MKLKDYFQSLVSKRKNNAKSTHRSKKSIDSPFEISMCDETRSRTELLLSRHAELVNSIVQTRSSQTNIDRPYLSYQPSQSNHRSYSSTLNMPEYQTEPSSSISSSHQSLWMKTRQRTKIRTNPWVHTGTTSHHQTLPTSGLIHSESFPLTIGNATSHINASPPTRLRHLTDNDDEFSIPRTNVIDQISFEKNRTSAFSSVPSRNRYKKPRKALIERTHSSRYPPYFHSDHYSIEFEDHLENSSPDRQQNSPFILPIDRNLSSKTSRSPLKHIEELDHDIERIQTLNLQSNESIRPTSIYEQVDEWVDACLTHPSLPPKVEMMTAFYLTTMPESWTPTNNVEKVLQECPF